MEGEWKDGLFFLDLLFDILIDECLEESHSLVERTKFLFIESDLIKFSFNKSYFLEFIFGGVLFVLLDCPFYELYNIF